MKTKQQTSEPFLHSKKEGKARKNKTGIKTIKFLFLVCILLIGNYQVFAFDSNKEGNPEKRGSIVSNPTQRSTIMDSNDISQIFYLAISYTQFEYYQEAIELFRVVLSKKGNIFNDAANWYLGLCFLKDGDTDKAKKQMKKVAKNNTDYSYNARRIYNSLKGEN